MTAAQINRDLLANDLALSDDDDDLQSASRDQDTESQAAPCGLSHWIKRARTQKSGPLRRHSIDRRLREMSMYFTAPDMLSDLSEEEDEQATDGMPSGCTSYITRSLEQPTKLHFWRPGPVTEDVRDSPQSERVVVKQKEVEPVRNGLVKRSPADIKKSLTPPQRKGVSPVVHKGRDMSLAERPQNKKENYENQTVKVEVKEEQEEHFNQAATKKRPWESKPGLRVVKRKRLDDSENVSEVAPNVQGNESSSDNIVEHEPSRVSVSECGVHCVECGVQCSLPMCPTPTPDGKKPSGFALVIPGATQGPVGGGPSSGPETETPRTGESALAFMTHCHDIDKEAHARYYKTSLETFQKMATSLKRESDKLKTSKPMAYPPVALRSAVYFLLASYVMELQGLRDRATLQYGETIQFLRGTAGLIDGVYRTKIKQVGGETGNPNRGRILEEMRRWQAFYAFLVTIMKAVLSYRQFFLHRNEATKVRQKVDTMFKNARSTTSTTGPSKTKTFDALTVDKDSRELLQRHLKLTSYLEQAYTYWRHSQSFIAADDPTKSAVRDIQLTVVRASGVYITGPQTSVPLLVHFVEKFLVYQTDTSSREEESSSTEAS